MFGIKLNCKMGFKLEISKLISSSVLAVLCVSALTLSPVNSSAVVNVTTVKKSWADLAPSKEALDSGAVYVLQSLEGYVDFDVRMITSTNPDFQSDLSQKYCLKNQNILILNIPCLNLLRTEYIDEFDQLLKEFIAFYDAETPSYQTVIKNSEYSSLSSSTVIERLQSNMPQSEPEIDPVSLLNASVYQALWTVPTNDANCFGTAYTAVTPNAKLRYRDYLWSSKTPAGFDHYNIEDDLVFGDIIEFEIRGDGHAIVYLGTDQDGDKIVLTKNGFMPSVVQVMKYDDVYKVYEYYGILNVNVWRYNSNSANGLASSNPNFDIDFLDSLVNTRKNSVQVSMDEAIARSFGKKWNDYLSKRK